MVIAMNIKHTRIAICANTEDPESNVSNRFARCEFYAVYNHETLEFDFEENKAKNEMSGAGAKAAKQIYDLGVTAVLVPEIGPKAYEALEAFEIEVYRYSQTYSVRDAIYDYYEKKLQRVLASTKSGKHAWK